MCLRLVCVGTGWEVGVCFMLHGALMLLATPFAVCHCRWMNTRVAKYMDNKANSGMFDSDGESGSD